jgi:glutamyl-tRNA reductase
VAIVVIGVNHRSAPLDLLERLTVGAEDLPKVLSFASQRDYVSEAVVVSTCNRTEIYAVVERFHDSYAGLRSVLSEHAEVPVADLADHLSVDFDEAAAGHLFSVAAGLDSAVIGETEILGQLKDAWRVARDEGAAGPHLNALFRHALHVGKRARTETGISRSVASASAAAVALASQRLDGLAGRRVLVLGAGDMGDQMAVALAGAGVAEVLVANRTATRAAELAERVGGAAVPFDRIGDVLADVDLLLTSTAAVNQVVNRATIEEVVGARHGRPLLIVDIAVPRDVDPRVAELPGVELCDMDDLRTFTEAGLNRRRGEISAVTEIIEDELVRFRAMRNARSVAPVISDLHARSEAIRRAELERFSGRLDGLTDRQRDAVEALTHGIVAKLLHRPSVRLGELAGTVRGDQIVDALADLYDMDDGDEGDRVTGGA